MFYIWAAMHRLFVIINWLCEINCMSLIGGAGATYCACARRSHLEMPTNRQQLVRRQFGRGRHRATRRQLHWPYAQPLRLVHVL